MIIEFDSSLRLVSCKITHLRRVICDIQQNFLDYLHDTSTAVFKAPASNLDGAFLRKQSTAFKR